MKWIKRLIALAAFGVVLYLFWPLLGELRQSAGLFRHARWGWLLAALGVQWLSYAFLTELNVALLRPFEGRIGFWRMMAILPTMAFIEVAIPSAGASGVVLRARLLGKSGYSAEAATFTLALETLYITAAMITASLSGLVYLIQSRQLAPAQVALLALIVLVLVTAGGLAYYAGRDPARVKRWAGWLAERLNRVLARLKRPPIHLEALYLRLEAFYAGLDHLRSVPKWPLVLLALGRVALDVVSLGVCFYAFRYAISPGVLLTGYGLMLLLSGLAALPGGLGLADASLAVIFARLGAPGAVAVAAALSYRLMAFWGLRFIGFITWQLLEARPAEAKL